MYANAFMHEELIAYETFNFIRYANAFFLMLQLNDFLALEKTV